MKKSIKAIAFLIAIVTLFISIPQIPLTSFAKEETGEVFTKEDAEKMGLPVINIKLDKGSVVTNKERYVGATMSIDPGSGFENCTNYYTMPEGAHIQIKCRGNSSYSNIHVQQTLKYSYKIKLDIKADLFGMGASKDWALISNIFDITNMRNKLVYDMAGSLGMTMNESVWCVLYMNGKYRGLYSLVETVGIDSDAGRVDTIDWEEEAEDAAEAIAKAENLSEEEYTALEEFMENDLSWITSGIVTYKDDKDKTKRYTVKKYYDTSHFDITSGYLIEYDYRYDNNTTKFYTPQGVPIQMDSPTALSTNTEMYSFVYNLIAKFEEAAFSPNFCTAEGQHWSEFVDIQSFIDFWLIFNFTKNIEFGYLSIYFYIDDGKIVFGPCWDFDNASGNQVTLNEEWMKSDTWFESGRAPWWRELYSDPYFVELARARWYDIRESVDVYLDQIDIYDAYLKNEGQKNYDKIGAPQNWYLKNMAVEGYKEEIEIFRNWMYDRVVWLDNKFAEKNLSIDGIGLVPSEKIIFTVESANGTKLEPDRLTTKGSACDYLYRIGKTGKLKIKIETLHTSFVKADIVINGKLYKKDAPLTLENSVTIEFDPLEYGAKDGERLVIFVAGYNSSSFYRGSYLTFNCTEGKNATANQYAVQVGDEIKLVSKSEGEIKLPEINETREGFKAVGWTDGNFVFESGAEVRVIENGRYYIKWEQIGVFEQFYLDPVTEPEKDNTIVIDNCNFIKYIGVQEKKSDDNLSLRFVSTIDKLYYDSVGYTITVKYSEITDTLNETTKEVYKEIYAAGNKISASDLEGAAIFMTEIENIPMSERTVEITVTPFAVKGNTVFNGETYRIYYVGGNMNLHKK